VLQENVIYHAALDGKKPERVIISASEGLDYDQTSTPSVPYEHVVLPGDRDT
jgi:adenine-specific DNA-methyltransferase